MKYTSKELKSWLADGDNEFTIGGRSTDFSLIASSLLWSIKNHFPPNKIPSEVLDEWESLNRILSNAENELMIYMDFVTAHAIKLSPPETS